MLSEGVAKQEHLDAAEPGTTDGGGDGEAIGNEKGGGHEGRGNVIVGFAFMPKKMDSMSKVVAVGPCDGVEFHALDFLDPPSEHDERVGRRLDVILHKLSDDIMFRHVRPEGNERLLWMEEYLSSHPECAMVDPIDQVSKVINRTTTLELLSEAYRRHGPAGGMPRPPRFLVIEKKGEGFRKGAEATRRDGFLRGVPAPDGGQGLKFPVICKPIEACGSRGSHTMVVALDETGMDDLPVPIVVQEYCNHGALLFKVCVIGDDVRVVTRPSVPDLPQGLTGSFTFDSQKPYPTWEEVERASVRTAKERRRQRQDDQPEIAPIPLQAITHCEVSNGRSTHVSGPSEEASGSSSIRVPYGILNERSDGVFIDGTPTGFGHPISNGCSDGIPKGSSRGVANGPKAPTTIPLGLRGKQAIARDVGTRISECRGHETGVAGEVVDSIRCGEKRKPTTNCRCGSTPTRPAAARDEGGGTFIFPGLTPDADPGRAATDPSATLTVHDCVKTVHVSSPTAVEVSVSRTATQGEATAAGISVGPPLRSGVRKGCALEDGPAAGVQGIAEGSPSSRANAAIPGRHRRRGSPPPPEASHGACCSCSGVGGHQVVGGRGDTLPATVTQVGVEPEKTVGPTTARSSSWSREEAEQADRSGISLEAARVAAMRMRETFGLSIFGFDLIVDSETRETMVIDVNYFPSFKDLHDFPQVLRRRLKDVAADAKSRIACVTDRPT